MLRRRTTFLDPPSVMVICGQRHFWKPQSLRKTGVSGSSSPDSTGSVETSMSSRFGGMSYPSSLVHGQLGPHAHRRSHIIGPEVDTVPVVEVLPSMVASVLRSYESPAMGTFESFENPLAGPGSFSYGSHDKGLHMLSQNMELHLMTSPLVAMMSSTQQRSG